MTNRLHAIGIASIGFIAGIAFILSCSGDDTPTNADAAIACDCPPAERPLNGRIVQVVGRKEIPAMSSSSAIAECDSDSIIISGGCFANSNDPAYVLNSSYPTPENSPKVWACRFYNGTASPVTSTAYVTCLKPAP
ncbi:MAG TPA: hypothetical protein PKU97_04315 [Kofleriaceae bacterium]|nr:hypothetical protein [Kofleriaceae bacterium]